MTKRKSRFGLGLVAALALHAIGTQSATANANKYVQITSESQLRELLVGVPLVGQNTSFQFNADYTFEGTYGGRPILGKWMWVADGGGFCIEVQVPRMVFYCRAPKIKNGQVSLVRFDRHPTVHGRAYLSNPYPQILAALEIRH